VGRGGDGGRDGAGDVCGWAVGRCGWRRVSREARRVIRGRARAGSLGGRGSGGRGGRGQGIGSGMARAGSAEAADWEIEDGGGSLHSTLNS
jgi:hypothetical protein